MTLTVAGTTFRDRHGRHIILRGVNLGGDCKVPFSPDGHTYRPTDFSDHRTVSFVGRPAPLDQIDGHLARLRRWGFNCLRLLTTWEAVEHAGPGEYDQAYLDYYAEVCRRAGEHGFYVFVDFHQDVWSRMSGGDGAPGWTFAAAGLDFTKFAAANAAHVMQNAYDHRLGGRQDSYPVMSWGSNYRMPANGIMWTMFFAGEDFAPSCMVDGSNIQTFLQRHYLGAMRAVAERVAHLENVIGFDTLNEPGTGYIGKPLEKREGLLRGPAWSPLDGLVVASGLPRELPVREFGKGQAGTQLVNQGGVSIWCSGRDDPFRAAGAWDIRSGGDPIALKSDYFEVVRGTRIDLERDYMVPFFNRVAETVRAVRDDWLVFAEVDPFSALRGHDFPDGCPERTVNASHWYDLTALVTKRFTTERMIDVFSGHVREGREAIQTGYVDELSRLKGIGDRLNGGAPTLIGECGIQYDMNEAEAYRRWAGGERDSSIWEAQATALELMYNALDTLLLSSTQWNYTVSNRNDPMVGDGWNQEDLSIWSADQAAGAADEDAGGRAISGFCRPYVRAAQGTLVRQTFDRTSGIFEAEIEPDPAISVPTEIYVPHVQYPASFTVSATSGAEIIERGELLHIEARSDAPISVRLERK